MFPGSRALCWLLKPVPVCLSHCCPPPWRWEFCPHCPRGACDTEQALSKSLDWINRCVEKTDNTATTHSHVCTHLHACGHITAQLPSPGRERLGSRMTSLPHRCWYWKLSPINLLYQDLSLWAYFQDVGGVCDFLGSVSSQEKFEAMDQHYSSQMGHRYSSLTDQCHSSVLQLIFI